MLVRWRNFRGFEDTGWIDLKPLTIVIGPNNSGKTSLYAPLLLLKQTRMPLMSAPRRSWSGAPLRLRGELFDAGSYSDLVFNHQVDRKIGFSFRLTHLDPGPNGPSGGHWDELAVDPADLDLVFEPAGHNIQLTSYTIKSSDGKKLFGRSRRASGRYTIGGAVWQEIYERARSNPALAEWVNIVRRERPRNFVFQTMDPIHYMTLHSGLDVSEVDRDEFASAMETMFRYNMLLERVGFSIDSALRGLSYLGPLRAAPRRWYEISGEDPASVGVAGQWAPEMLFGATDELKSAAQDWLGRFGFGSKIDVREYEPELFGLYLQRSPSATPVSFADCGFGASQILPIILEALVADKSSRIVIEQPEIHLNPKLQALLGDLLVETSRRRAASVIVETHSEHLLMRVRTLIAKGAIDASDVAIYFAEQDEDTARFRKIDVEGDGNIPPEEWPTDFFGESLDGALQLAYAQMER